ncbi:MAG: AMP-binding protein [Oscillospiraceae bacterium]|nr:AMP-binding protein [Oscillospiraceae bacterium]
MINEAFYKTRKITDFKDMLKSSAVLFPMRPALMGRDKNGEIYSITYRNLLNNVNALGTALCSLGLKGEKIAVMGKNSPQWCCAYLSITCGTGVVVPMDKELMPDDIAGIINAASCRALFFDKAAGEKLLEAKEKLPEDIILISLDGEINEALSGESFDSLLKKGEELLNSGDKTFLEITPDPEALTSLIFTSGTTGNAKGVMLSARNICSDITAVSSVVKITPEDRILSVLPLHHTYECTLSFLMLMYSGGCLCFCEGLRYIQRDMQQFEPTVFVTVPLMLEKFHARILKKVSEKKMGRFALSLGKLAQSGGDGFVAGLTEKIFAEVKKQFGGKLRLIITGAAALNPEVARDFKTFGLPVYIGYGLTECSPLVIGNNDRLQLPDSVGVPLPGVEAKINAPDVNGVGEIFVKGPMVMMGYYNNEEATKEVFTEDGWFKTGDMGTVDSENRFKIVGRCKNVIVTKNGKNIYPEEVEYYLNKNPFISESLVFGTDCDEADEGTRVEAKIFPDISEIMAKFKNQTPPTKEQVLKTISEVVKEVNKKLPKYKHIRRFDIRENEFIKTTTNKIKRHANMHDEEASKQEITK